jgi:hemerythrin-like domain-containing protein
MQPTEILMNEHRVIEQVLNCLEAIAQRAISEDKLDRVAVRKALDFLQNFADRCHHGKEEQHLFPTVEARGMSREHGPTGVMLSEHDQGRQHIQAMAAAIEEVAAGWPEALQRFVDHAQSYVRLLREHIMKEDLCLFPMANRVLTEDDQHALMSAFEKVEHEDMGLGVHEDYLDLANELADHLDVPRADVGPTAGLHCCGHHATH